jgi:hypothetical protein
MRSFVVYFFNFQSLDFEIYEEIDSSNETIADRHFELNTH